MFVSVGCRPFPAEPARAGALFQHRAPASQQDECRLGSQAGGNPRSLLWLCAPADLQPGFAVIPTSCCRSLISWKKPQNPNPKLLWLKLPAARWWGGVGSSLPRHQVGDWKGWERLVGRVSLLGMGAEKTVFVSTGDLCRATRAGWMGLGLRH